MSTTLHRFWMRRGAAVEWSAQNTILGPGEWGLETDTGKAKVGNGVTTWSLLPYSVIPAPSTAGQALISTGAGDFAYADVGTQVELTAESVARAAGDAARVLTESVLASAGTLVVRSRVTGDANPRWSVKTNGLMEWGGGSGALDTSLTRSSVGTLTANGDVVVNSLRADYVQDKAATKAYIDLVSGATGVAVINRTTTSAVPFTVRGMAAQTGDLQRWNDGTGATVLSVSASGSLTFGGATALINFGNESAASNTVIGANVAGDTVARFLVTADGKHQWGPGNAAVDTNLYRVVAGALKTDTDLWAGTNVAARIGGATQVLLGFVAGGASGIEFGLAQDTNLYRYAADVLKTDDLFIAGGGVTVPNTGAAVRGDGNLYLDAGALGSHSSEIHLRPDVTGLAAALVLTGSAATFNVGTVVKWGTDTNLYRSAVNTLKSDGNITAAGYLLSGGPVYAREAQASRTVIGDFGPSGEAGIAFGLAQDTSMYRLSAGYLRTPGNIVIDGNDCYVGYSGTSQVRIGDATGSAQAGIRLGSSGDTNLYRSAADTLRTDDNLYAAGFLAAYQGLSAQATLGALGPSGEAGLAFGSSADTYMYRSGAGVINTNGWVFAGNDVAGRIGSAAQTVIGAEGPGGQSGILFGSAGDTNLYRWAANTLATDDALRVGGRLSLLDAGAECAFLRTDNGGNAVYNGTGTGAIYLNFDSGTGGVNFADGAGTVTFGVTSAGLPKWTAAANAQTTVGAAGGASALPATPTKYLKVKDSAGTTLVIPAYAP